MPDTPNANPAGGPAGGGFSRPPQPTPLPAGGPRHTRSADDTAQIPVQRPERAAAGSDGQRPRLLQQRLQGAFLTIIGIAGIVGGVLFSIEAPRFTPVPVVFLTFWLVMVIVGRILFTGLNKLRAAGITAAPAPHQVRAAAAVAAIVVAVGMMGFAATSAGSGTAAAAPCPGGGPAPCGPDPNGRTLTFTPPPAQTNAPGGQQGGQQGGQDNNGIATSPAQGGNNGPGIQAQTPEFGTPGQQAPDIPGNEQPGQGGQQQPAQGQQTGQQSAAQTTAPGQPQQTGQPTQSGQQPTPSTITVTQTQSQCPAPGAAAAPGAAGPGGGAPGAGGSGGGAPGGGDGGTSGGPDGDGKDGAPSWAYLVAEATGVMAGRRRNTGGAPTPSANAPTDAANDTASLANDTSSLVDDSADQAPASEQPIASAPDAGSADTTDEPSSADQPSDGTITKELPEDDSTSVLHSYTSTGMRVPMPGEYGPFTPEQEAARHNPFPDLNPPAETPPSTSGGGDSIDPASSAATGAAAVTQSIGDGMREAGARPGEVVKPRIIRPDVTKGRHAVTVGGEFAPDIARAGKILGPVGFVAGTAAEVAGSYQAWRNKEITGGEAIAGSAGALTGGALGGMAAGAAVGSFAGPVGTAIGAGVGAVVGSELGKRASKKILSWFS